MSYAYDAAPSKTPMTATPTATFHPIIPTPTSAAPYNNSNEKTNAVYPTNTTSSTSSSHSQAGPRGGMSTNWLYHQQEKGSLTNSSSNASTIKRRRHYLAGLTKPTKANWHLFLLFAVLLAALLAGIGVGLYFLAMQIKRMVNAPSPVVLIDNKNPACWTPVLNATNKAPASAVALVGRETTTFADVNLGIATPGANRLEPPAAKGVFPWVGFTYDTTAPDEYHRISDWVTDSYMSSLNDIGPQVYELSVRPGISTTNGIDSITQTIRNAGETMQDVFATRKRQDKASPELGVVVLSVQPMFALRNDSSYLKQEKEWMQDVARACVEVNSMAGAGLIIRYAPNHNSNWEPYQNQAALFKDSFRRLSTLLRAKSNMTAMMFSPAINMTLPPDFHSDNPNAAGTWEEYYPGDEYVDWIGTQLFTPAVVGYPWGKRTYINQTAPPSSPHRMVHVPDRPRTNINVSTTYLRDALDASGLYRFAVAHGKPLSLAGTGTSYVQNDDPAPANYSSLIDAAMASWWTQLLSPTTMAQLPSLKMVVFYERAYETQSPLKTRNDTAATHNNGTTTDAATTPNATLPNSSSRRATPSGIRPSSPSASPTPNTDPDPDYHRIERYYRVQTSSFAKYMRSLGQAANLKPTCSGNFVAGTLGTRSGPPPPDDGND